MIPVALTIAGSDPSGGAGLEADLKTFYRFGVYGEAVVTLIAVQNTLAVTRVETLAADLVRDQIRAATSDIVPQAAKTGALGSAAVVDVVAAAAAEFGFPLVVDPVRFASQGTSLLDRDAWTVFVKRMVPRAFLLTPNLEEASALAGFAVNDAASMRRAAEALTGMGAANVLIKGGHLADAALDVLFSPGAGFQEFRARQIVSRHTHGTGCTCSAAITAALAKGASLPTAIQSAKDFVTRAIRTAPGLGAGTGPLNHFA
jgi:hydroxymethylpyrimidine/phosphomethylpyrimidine kinase